VSHADLPPRYQIAQQLPRSWDQIGEELLKLCANPEFAYGAFHGPPRNELSGAFADAAQQLIRNLDLQQCTQGGFEMITLVDLETNLQLTAPFTPTARRSLVLSFVPSVLRLRCLAACKETVLKDVAEHLAPRTKQLVIELGQFGMTAAEIRALVGHAPSGLTLEEFDRLRSTLVLLRDGELKLPPRTLETAPEPAAAAPKKRKTRQPRAAAAPKPPEPGTERVSRRDEGDAPTTPAVATTGAVS